jgi:hypothetical protein
MLIDIDLGYLPLSHHRVTWVHWEREGGHNPIYLFVLFNLVNGRMSFCIPAVGSKVGGHGVDFLAKFITNAIDFLTQIVPNTIDFLI